ncbi:endogenous retrovirus group K member 6 Env polyprotein-like isoform X2 [Dipodomys merriami]
MNPSGCLSIALGLWRLILMTQTLTHWAYVPDPPIVRPTTWEGIEVLIHVNRSVYSTALDHFIQHTKMADTSASDIGTPFYFTTSSKGSIPGCIIMLSMTHKIWIPDKNQMYNIQMTSLPTGYPVHANFTPSYMIPHCINSSQIIVSTGKPHPIRCRHVKPFVTNISGTKFQLMDWFGANLTNKYNFGLWWMNGHPQHHVWMLVAALNNITWPNSSLSKNIMSCVSPPHVIMYRPFNISIGANYFNVTCSNCSFTNCLYSGITESILIVRQPSVVMLPVNISKTWYKDSGIQVLRQLKKLMRPHRFVGLLVADVLAFILLAASSAAAAVALTQNAQTVHYLNQLAHSTTQALPLDAKVAKTAKKNCLNNFNSISLP